VLLEPSSSSATRLRRLTFSFHLRPPANLQSQFHTPKSAVWNYFTVDMKAQLCNRLWRLITKTSLEVAVRTSYSPQHFAMTCVLLHPCHAVHSRVQFLLNTGLNRAQRCRTGTVIDRYRATMPSALRKAVPRYRNALYITDFYCKLHDSVRAIYVRVPFKTNTLNIDHTKNEKCINSCWSRRDTFYVL
jgi:hypothetical protein